MGGEEGIPLIKIDEWDASDGTARCNINCDTKIEAGITWGCRNITFLSTTGCPLRDGDLVRVRL